MRLRLIPAAIALAAFTLPAAAQQFSADLVRTGAEQSPPGKIYVSEGKVRMENADGHGGALIADGAAGKTYVLMPQRKMYMDLATSGGKLAEALMPVDVDNPCPQWQKMAQAGEHETGSWSCKNLGDERVNGRTAVKYAATASDGKVHYAWLDRKLHFLVKTQDPDGDGMELRNIKEGAQPASLFEPPADYQKLDMGNMMQQMLQHMQQQQGAGHP